MFVRSWVCVVAVVLLVGSVAWAADGAAVYKEQCAKCHGAEGKSDTPVGEKLKIPPIAGNAKIAAMPESEIAALIKGTKKHPPKTTEMSDGDLSAVAGHVKGLAGAN